MKKKVFWSGVEYLYMQDSKDFDKLKGGFTYVFVNAFDAREVMDKLLLALNEKKFRPVEVEFISPYDNETEWESIDITNHYRNLGTESINTNEVVFDDLYAYETD